MQKKDPNQSKVKEVNLLNVERKIQYKEEPLVPKSVALSGVKRTEENKYVSNNPLYSNYPKIIVPKTQKEKKVWRAKKLELLQQHGEKVGFRVLSGCYRQDNTWMTVGCNVCRFQWQEKYMNLLKNMLNLCPRCLGLIKPWKGPGKKKDEEE